MKTLAATIAILVCTALSGCASLGEPSGPKIVEIFACSDYCPGPRKRYLKRVYKGVSDNGECRALGGRPYTYIGWDETTVCLAD